MPYIVQVGLLFAIYFGAAKLGLAMDAVSGFATAVWPPTGIALAALSRFGYRLWPGVALGAFLVNALAGAPMLTALGMAGGNTLEALVGTYLLQHVVGCRPALDRLRDVLSFVVLAAGLSTLVSATMGVTSGWLGGVIPSANYRQAWWTWWLGDMMGDLVVAPLLLIWTRRPRISLSPRRVAELGALLVAVSAISLLVFGSIPATKHLDAPYLLFPVLIWAALRFDQHWAVAAIGLASTLTIWGTVQGFGPFVQETLHQSLLVLQAFMSIVAVTILVLAAAVTECKRAEASRQEHYSLLQAIVEGTTDAIFVKDLEGRYLMINSAGAHFLGRPVEEILGKGDIELFSPDTARAIIEVDRAVIRSGETRTYEEVGTSMGITRTYLSAKGVYRGHQGNIIGLFGISRDITARKHLEDQLRQSQKMEAIGKLAARVAHEVHNPLAIIKTGIRIIKNQTTEDGPTVGHLQVIEEEVSRIARIIQELLEFSRPAPTQEMVQVNAVIQSLEPLLAHNLHEKQIALRVTLASELPLVQISADQLKQVVLNMVRNAEDVMPQGGDLVIRTTRKGPAVEVSITDTGCGIRHEYLERLFEPFFTTKEKGRGLGLGLSISYGIIKSVNGRIDVESEVGRGSTFRVSLPAAAEPQGGISDASTSRHPPH